jgi:hypothetical protein
MEVLKISKQSKKWHNEKAELLFSIAKESLPYDKAQQSNLQVLKSYITILKTFKKELTDMRALIVSRADSLSEFPLLTSIPGVGEIEEGKAIKSALTATSSKLLRIIYGILKNGEAFKAT